MGYKSKYTGAEIDEAIERMPQHKEIIHKAGFSNSTIATADGLFDEFNGLGYVVPDSRSFIEGNYDEVLATQSYVDEHIPTEIATAPQRVLLSSAPANNEYMANIVYEWQGTPNAINIDALSGGDDATIACGLYASDVQARHQLSLPQACYGRMAESQP